MEMQGQSLIDSFVVEHRAIQRLLDEAMYEGVGSAQCKAKLYKAKQLILSHLQKEDDLLYPVLMEHHFSELAENYAQDMLSISKDVLNFFEKFENGEYENQIMEFAKALGNIIGVLGHRIQTEEVMLYKRYIECIEKAPPK
ncbi:hemerythrin domain-containing protein [Spartinivicinus ruber]|uniref:hemerythrin domain-containing protein n=1 Tax=Spartinivicinus ruber TaxID=2683272 RepID=UPI0013D5A315|nr:hemerythrin domain-containing protein [Spartinivicinus ruber]